MNIDKLVEIHNDAFCHKVSNSHFKLTNIHKIELLDDVAYLIILDSIDVYEIYEIAVKKNYQKKGYATRLMQLLPKDKPIMLEVNENNTKAIKLYEKFNFRLIHIRKNYYDTDDAYILKKE